MSINLKGLFGKLNRTTRSALEGAAGLCVSRTHYDIEFEHFLLKLLEVESSDFSILCRSSQINHASLTDALLRSLDKLKQGNGRSPAFSPSLVDALSSAWLYASLDFEAKEIRSGHFILATIDVAELARLLHNLCPEFKRIDAERVRREFGELLQGSSEQPITTEPPHSPEASVVSKPTTGPHIFLSYRHDDGSRHADFLFMSLLSNVPGASVFRDSDTLKPGMVFSDMLTETVGACDILLAIIGKKWAGRPKGGGARRIDQPEDWVRFEIAAALAQNKLVIPCLVDGATMPPSESLPPELAGLALRQAARLSETDFRHDTGELAERINEWHRSR